MKTVERQTEIARNPKSHPPSGCLHVFTFTLLNFCRHDDEHASEKATPLTRKHEDGCEPCVELGVNHVIQ